jgi:hypothetical protein
MRDPSHLYYNSSYNSTWNKNDPNWTDELAAQVPYGIDPRKDNQGVFVAPVDVFLNGSCFI